MRIADFRKYLIGNPKAKSIGGKRGLLSASLCAAEMTSLSEEMCRQFTIDLGYEHADLRKGSFNDKHNSEENITDRSVRFIPEYMRLFALGPSYLTINSERVCVDELADQSLRLNQFYEITGGVEVLEARQKIEITRNEAIRRKKKFRDEAKLAEQEVALK